MIFLGIFVALCETEALRSDAGQKADLTMQQVAYLLDKNLIEIK